MTSLADRLRGVILSGGPEGQPCRSSSPPDHDAAEVLDGEWRESRGRKFLVIDRKYSPGYRHGRVAVADCLPPWPCVELLGGAPGRTVFLDVETTGLAGGAGSYAFLVGCGWFDGATFRLRQLFLSDFAAERALLESFAELAAGADCVVTYNGKSFDLPLMDTRFALQRIETPFAGLPHLDMLHPARLMWRDEQVECRLTYLEQALCGHEREGDIPGFEIPSRYFQYVRSGDARPLSAVLEHNRLDIVSLAMLTARASQMLDEGPSAATTPREAYGMGRLYERAGWLEQALACFQRACATDYEVGLYAGCRADALRASAVLLRRLRRYEDAASAWRELSAMRGCPQAYAREAMEALAVHHEHRARDLETARNFALQSLQLPTTAARQQAVRYRLARLDRKLGSSTCSIPF
jgi:tetratricopeptide (TPR) repeat protein